MVSLQSFFNYTFLTAINEKTSNFSEIVNGHFKIWNIKG